MRFAADENFDGRILQGLQTRLPDLDIVRVQEQISFNRLTLNYSIGWLLRGEFYSRMMSKPCPVSSTNGFAKGSLCPESSKSAEVPRLVRLLTSLR